MDRILFYKSVEPYGYLNNFCKVKIFVYDDWFPTVEHAYQIQKTLSAVEYNLFKKEAKTPRLAQKLGQKLTCRSDWDSIKIEVMKNCVLAKFTQHHNLLEKLLSTENAEIIEDSDIDSFWGRGPDWKGKNMLGKILMEVRAELSGYSSCL